MTAFNADAMTAVCISALGQLAFIRWAVIDNSKSLESPELWVGRVALLAMAAGDVWAIWSLRGVP